MSKTIKRVVSLLLTLCLIFSLGIFAGAETSDRVRTQMEGLGLMQGYEDGDFGADDELTRAQMAMIIARILQLEGMNVGVNPFTDVPENHWAHGVIGMLSDLKIVNGMGDGTFMLDRSVTYFEAIKMIVTVLGYEGFAENQGGYPSGYTMQAGKMGILKDVLPGEGAITRGEVAKILYNALSVKPMGSNFMQNYLTLEYTLYEILTDNKDLVRFTGILTETSTASLVATEPALKSGYIAIGGTRLETDMLMDDYLGCELIVYAQVDENDRPSVLKNFIVTGDTTITEAAADAVTWSGTTATILLSDDSEDELNVPAGAQTLYNGRLASIPANERAVSYGSYTFIDNDGDGVIDVLRINEAQSFIVDKVTEAKSTVYFKNNATLNGRRAVILDKTDEDKTITVLDTEGNEIEIADIEAGDGITVFASNDTDYVKAIISTRNISGKITEVSSEGIRINGEAYKVALKPDGSANFTPEVNAEGTYVFDCFGNVIGSIGAVVGQYQYAYVIDAGSGTGLDKTLSLRTITGTEPVKEVTTTAGVDSITYYFQNDSIKIYECAENVMLYDAQSAPGVGSRVKSAELDPAQFSRSMIAFRLNGEGQINELHTYDVSEAPFLTHVFNAKAMTFGGEGITRGYATDEATKFICIPNGVSPTLSDYSVQVSYADADESVKVFGTVFIPSLDYADANSEPVDIVLISANMNAASAPVPSASADICIVGSVSKAVSTAADDAGGMVYELELLNGENVIRIATATSGEAYNVAASLRKGDLIRYVKDGFGRIAGIQKLYSVQGLADNFSNNINIQGTSFRGQYGFIYDVIIDSYDPQMNDYIDKVYLTFTEDGNGGDVNLNSYLRAANVDAPPVYHYNRKSGWITPGSLEDITASAYAGSEASKAFVLTESSAITAIVIIED